MTDYQLWLGDCLEEMDRIESGSVDAIIADLPYQTTNCHWDKMIPLEPLWAQYKRVIKRNGAVVLFGSQPFTTFLIASSPYFGTGKQWFKYELVWDKHITTSPGLAKYRPLPVHETLLVFGNGSMAYSPQMELGHQPYAKRNGTRSKNGNEHKYGYKGGFLSVSNGERYPKSIIRFSNANQAAKEHSTQKPVALLEYLIKTYTNEGELVLDNTAGSFSTGEAALRTGRRFIGIEKDANYYQIGVERMERVSAELRGEFVPKVGNGKLEDLPMFQEAGS